MDQSREALTTALRINQQRGFLYPHAHLALAEVLVALGKLDEAAVALYTLTSSLESVGLHYPAANALLSALRESNLFRRSIPELERVMLEERAGLQTILRGLSAKHAKKLGAIYRGRIVDPNRQ